MSATGFGIAPSAKWVASSASLDGRAIHAAKRELLKLSSSSIGAGGIVRMGCRPAQLQSRPFSSGSAANRRLAGGVTRGPVRQLSPELVSVLQHLDLLVSSIRLPPVAVTPRGQREIREGLSRFSGQKK